MRSFTHGKLFLSLLLIPFSAALIFSQEEIREVRISGGPIYTAWPQEDSSITCGIIVEAPTTAPQRQRPIQLVFLLDVSHAMQGEPLQSSIKAAKAVLGALSDGDLFGLVTYSTYTRIVFPLQPITSGNRRNAQSAIERLGDENDRNMSEGLKKAAEELDKFKGQDAISRHIFLLTNGVADKGVTDPEQLYKLAMDLSAKTKSSISAFGYKQKSSDFQEDLLSDIALFSNGRYYFIEQQDDMVQPFVHETERISRAAVRKVELEILPPDNASVDFVEGGILKDGKICVGDIRAGGRQLVLFELVGRPAKQKDCVVNTYYLEPDGFNVQKNRDYIDISLSTGTPEFNPEIAPMILSYELLYFVVQNSQELKTNRRAFTAVFRDKLLEMERYNNRLDSDYLRDSIKFFNELEFVMSNAALEDELIIKRIKYRALKMLYDL